MSKNYEAPEIELVSFETNENQMEVNLSITEEEPF